MITVAIADDHPMVIRGIEAMLMMADDITIVNSFTRGQALLDGLSKERPDILLLDINLPDFNGVELCGRIRRAYPELEVIGLSNYGETSFIKSMIRNGAKSYLFKNTDKDELITAIRTVNDGGQYLPSKIKEMLINDSLGKPSKNEVFKRLSSREQQVLELIAQELTTQEIADKLFISNKTVESHRKSLLHKLDAKNVAGLIRNALNQGLIT